MTPERCIAALKALASKWGGSVQEVDEDTFDEIEDLELAPFTGARLGVVYATKTVYYCGDVPWVDLVHEMGHVFACNETPEGSQEWDFFGWEYAIVRKLRGVKLWVRSNSGYIINKDGDTFGELSRSERQATLRERVAHAHSTGLLKNGEPQAIR